MQETCIPIKNPLIMPSNYSPLSTHLLHRRMSSLFVGALILLTIGLNLAGLWDFDEGFYAQISLEMAQEGDWVYTTFNGEPRFDKPPLLYWMIRFFYAMIGVNEWAVRLPSALMGAATVWVTALFARRLTADVAEGWRLGLWSGTILATSVVFFLLARMGMMDVGLTLFVSLALYAYTRTWATPDEPGASPSKSSGRSDRLNLFDKYGSNPVVAWILVGVFTGLGTLMKGPVAAILVGLTLIVFTFVDERLPGLIRLPTKSGPWISVLAALIVAGPWHVAITLRAGKAFWDRYFGFHQVGLYTSEFQDHGGPWYYHILVMIFGLLPWSAILPWFKRGAIKESSGVDPKLVRFLWVWLGSTLIFFSASATKAPAYTLPAFPAAALILARLWLTYAHGKNDGHDANETLSKTRRHRWLSPSLITAVLAAVLALGVQLLKSQAPAGYEGVADLLLWTPITLLVVSLIAVTMSGFRQGTGTHHLWAAAANALLLALLLSFAIIPPLDAVKPQKTLAPIAASLADERGVPFGSVLGRGGDASTRFYARQPVVFLDNLRQAASFLMRDERPYLLALADDQAELAATIATMEDSSEGSSEDSSEGLSQMQAPKSVLEVVARAGNGVLLRLTDAHRE